MQATLPPWQWAGRRGARGGARGGARARRRRLRLQLRPAELRAPPAWRPRADLAALYTPSQIRHLIRWESALGAAPPTAPAGWPRDPALSWRLQDLAFQHLSLEPRAAPVPTRAVAAGGAVGGGVGAAGGWWEGAGRGLSLGAALLAAVLLLVRLADKCLASTMLHKLTMRRRQSEEWPTPSVMATSLAVRMTSDMPLEDCPPPASLPPRDLPPPYSECTPPAGAASKPEDPPPPYSACYVTYSNPKDRPPSVQLYCNTGLIGEAGSSRDDVTESGGSGADRGAAGGGEDSEREVRELTPRERFLLV